VSKGERARSRSANNMTISSVLRTVARTLEFVVISYPWNDATKVGAHGIETVTVEGSSIIVYDEVSWVTLDTLNKVTSVLLVGLSMPIIIRTTQYIFLEGTVKRV